MTIPMCSSSMCHIGKKHTAFSLLDNRSNFATDTHFTASQFWLPDNQFNKTWPWVTTVRLTWLWIPNLCPCHCCTREIHDSILSHSKTSDARPSYLFYFVLCVCDHKQTLSVSSSWSGCNWGAAAEASEAAYSNLLVTLSIPETDDDNERVVCATLSSYSNADGTCYFHSSKLHDTNIFESFYPYTKQVTMHQIDLSYPYIHLSACIPAW